MQSTGFPLFKRAVSVTIPVMLGYLFMGMAFGILLQNAGYTARWAFLMPLVIYGGTMQYMAIPFLTEQAGLLTVAITTLLVHFRHFVYGLSFIQRFKPFGLRKYYMIFAMTDETYALMCSVQCDDTKQDEHFLFYIALCNHIYWIVGCVSGAIVGAFLQFDTKGIDFAMTALFIVIAVEQWRSAKSKYPALLGAGAALVSLLLFGADRMIIPAIMGIMLCLLAMRKPLEPLVISQEEPTP